MLLSSQVLERDPENVKAFYRLGQAHLSQEEYEEGIAAINKGLEVTYSFIWILLFSSLLFSLYLTNYVYFIWLGFQVAPDDANLKSVLALLTKKQAEFKKKEKSLYANMFK
ncbi:hypothetical protein BC937DRAFT_94101 [Endogone sp. FLAS-F59071]|nr:hypothetical protein BC937DRAFT_94101 [Endogone sp. FLAS-F59071]|eukprot:RUS14255.1 hypothetical protein BC937DRAFT_94101 [Endogone sp. FLAS-F59071]